MDNPIFRRNVNMYNKVVVAIDLSESSKKIIDAALNLVDDNPDKLALVHVVTPIPTVVGMESYAMDPGELQKNILDNSGQKLEEFGNRSKIDKSSQHTLLGKPALEIRNLAGELDADAIVIGSHGYSGWKVVLGSTAIKLLHGATCDVLTIYVGDD